jgi:hypothetical protein
LARKSNTTTTAMDKSSFFFTANCGVCHPGGAAMQYDRNGKLYYDRNTGTYGYNDAATLPVAAQLDGDYGFINPSNGVPATANWAKNGVSEADCLMCHMTRFASAPGTANHNAGVSWHKRSALLRGFSQAGMAGVANFEAAPTAGAGWAAVTYVAGQSPPMGSAATINYGLGITAGTLATDASGNLQIPAAVIGSAQDANCRLCHSVPDGKKSGRTLLATTDVHVQKSVACTRCHETPNDGVNDSIGMAKANPHQIGKGDITIGSVRNDLDGTVKDCADCHLGGADLQAPNPTAKHAAIPGFHFGFMKCQACHIRHMDDDGLATPTQDIPELVIEMSSNGTQNVSIWSAYLGTDPLDPSKDLPGWAPPYASPGSRTFRWYPALRWYKGKLTTVKPLYTAWFGEWLSGTGDQAVIRPIPLRLVRKALANNYAAGAARLASLVLTPGTKVATGAPILHRKAEIKVFLETMRDAVDTANPDTAQNDIVLRPVLVRAEKVYFLNDAGEVEYFESAVGESHDFAVNHNVVVKRDEANPVVNPGPYGAGGCSDCHGTDSAFFHGQQLHEPAQYDFLDEAGTVPNPDAGKPSYVSHYQMMGYTKSRADRLTARAVPVLVRVTGVGTISNGAETFSAASGTTSFDAVPGSTVTLTASPGPGTTPAWTGCTPSGDGLSCTADAGIPTSGAENPGFLVTVAFEAPVPPPPTEFTLTLTQGGAGSGTVAISTPAGAIPWSACSGATCTAPVPNGAVVTLVATPAAGSDFTGWGIVCTGTGPCSFTMNAQKSASATFQPSSQPLSVSVTGPGTVSSAPAGISCAAGAATGCSASYVSGTAVTLTATPSPGKVFKGWTGNACRGTTPTCAISMGAATSVGATFGDPTFPLTVTLAGAGSGSVSGSGITCTTGSTAGCTSNEASGSTVTLTAAAGASSVFTGWSGCSQVTTAGACVVPMFSARSVTATFAPATYPLSVQLKGTATGTVTGTAAGSPIAFTCAGTACTATVANGAAVVLTAVPNAGSSFSGWGVVCAGTGTCSFKMNAAKSPWATFKTP